MWSFTILSSLLLSVLVINKSWASSQVAIANVNEAKDVESFQCQQEGERSCESNETEESAPVIPIGASYQVSYDMLFVGRQYVELTILDDTRAHLIVDGGYPIDDYLTYAIVDGDDEGKVVRRFSVQLSEYVESILRRFHTRLSQIRYDTEKDAPSVVVSFMRVITFPLRLHRVKD